MNIVYGCASLTANWIMLEEHNRKALKLRPSSGKFLIELNLSPHSSFELMLLNHCFLKLGTGLSIMMAKRNPSLITTFAFLSCGYVCSSYQEVKSVVLRTLNRARLNVAIDSFLKTGRVSTLHEGNRMEKTFSFPWSKERPVVLGPRFKDAFQDPNSNLAIEPIFEKERYIVTYNPSKGNIYALLKD
ncbi:Protein root UVB sensitive 6 [Camellia lanceoleosa]|uniref:Protein root UVB sensitive 6 n=1 Tax=Camellia lanceoleosa TaxID=1840588 RepID=A0ACC0HSA0_9ERIC|nr:Protein root UVB sensitive 6 [Camellia lanceoleosa]